MTDMSDNEHDEDKYWIDLEKLTEKQEATIRDLADEMGYTGLVGLAGFLNLQLSSEWNYYDIIKMSCRE